MPYILESHRRPLMINLNPKTPGELNYVLSQIVRAYLAHKGLNYTALNDISGVLSCLSMEIYRRIASPYEDVKIKENGDVF